jgi:hypothetical protein
VVGPTAVYELLIAVIKMKVTVKLKGGWVIGVSSITALLIGAQEFDRHAYASVGERVSTEKNGPVGTINVERGNGCLAYLKSAGYRRVTCAVVMIE